MPRHGKGLGFEPPRAYQKNLAACTTENPMLTHPTNYPTNSVRILRNRQKLRNATLCHLLNVFEMLRFSRTENLPSPTVSTHPLTTFYPNNTGPDIVFYPLPAQLPAQLLIKSQTACAKVALTQFPLLHLTHNPNPLETREAFP